jgi:prepilin-type N-terminal cleavage/methylation domain-containing protein
VVPSRVDRSGYSLVEVLVGLALLGVLVSAVVAMMVNHQTIRRRVALITDWSEQASRVSTLLAAAETCKAILGGQPTDASDLSMKLGALGIDYTAGKVSGAWQIQSVSTQSVTTTSPRRLVRVSMSATPKVATPGASNEDFSKIVLVNISGSTITDCGGTESVRPHKADAAMFVCTTTLCASRTSRQDYSDDPVVLACNPNDPACAKWILTSLQNGSFTDYVPIKLSDLETAP